MPRPPPSPHDTLVKHGFSVPEHAAAELKAVLPPELAAHFDWNSLKVESGSFVDKALEQSHSDLLYSVRINDEPAFVYLLFEHMSSRDRQLALRLLRYVLRILERWASTNKHTLPLPPVIAVVLHHSKKGWRAPTDLVSLFGDFPDRFPAIRPYLPQLKFVLDDISHISDDELRARALGVIPTLFLAALRDCRNGDKILKTLNNLADLVQLLLTRSDGADAFFALYSYISKVADNCSPETIGNAFIQLAPVTESHVMTAAQILEQRGFDKGLARGEAKVLERQLTQRFGTLPITVRAQMDSATTEQLELWADRVLSAASLDAVFT